MSETLIRVENVSKKFCRDLKKGLWYGAQDITREVLGKGKARELRDQEFWAVRDVTFDVKRGECLGLIGHNGAGKSTLLKMLNGLIKPDDGKIVMHGRIGALIELGAGFNPILTGLENIYINGSILGLTKHEIDRKLDAIIEFSEIGDFLATPVQYYSSGMKVRLGFAVAAHLEPDILIIDEVLAVGDAGFRAKCFNRISSLMKNTAVIFVSHNMPQMTRLSTKLLLLEKGRSLELGTNMGEIIARYHASLNIKAEVRDHGSGTVSIEKVLLLDENSNNVNKVYYGDPFNVSIFFRLKKEGLQNLRMLIIVTDQEQNGVAQVLQPIDTFESGRLIEAKVFIEQALFNAGKYNISVAILEGQRGELTSVIHNLASFVVKDEAVGYAPIILRATRCETAYVDNLPIEKSPT